MDDLALDACIQLAWHGVIPHACQQLSATLMQAAASNSCWHRPCSCSIKPGQGRIVGQSRIGMHGPHLAVTAFTLSGLRVDRDFRCEDGSLVRCKCSGRLLYCLKKFAAGLRSFCEGWAPDSPPQAFSTAQPAEERPECLRLIQRS